MKPFIELNSQRHPDFQDILSYVMELRGLDFKAYRMRTISHRLALRMKKTGSSDFAAYLRYLHDQPQEIDALIDALTIKVSNFFRNSYIFEVLKEFILPKLLEAHKKAGLRIWSAGCARGEEIYSVAILLKELGATPGSAFLIATDIDQDALIEAGQALYRAEALPEVKKMYLDRYFIKQSEELYALNDEIRSMVTFASHDLTTCTPPKKGIFSDYHLILCRNVLIYLNVELQQKVVDYMTRLISPQGFLVLGEAETIPPSLTAEFVEFGYHTKIFCKGGIMK